MKTINQSQLTKSQQLKRISLDGIKSRESLIGKQVKYIGNDCIKNQLETNHIYTIKSISAGNYEAFVYLEGLPEKRYSDYSRMIVPNSYKIDEFELVQVQ